MDSWHFGSLCLQIFLLNIWFRCGCRCHSNSPGCNRSGDKYLFYSRKQTCNFSEFWPHVQADFLRNHYFEFICLEITLRYFLLREQQPSVTADGWSCGSSINWLMCVPKYDHGCPVAKQLPGDLLIRQSPNPPGAPGLTIATANSPAALGWGYYCYYFGRLQAAMLKWTESDLETAAFVLLAQPAHFLLCLSPAA